MEFAEGFHPFPILAPLAGLDPCRVKLIEHTAFGPLPIRTTGAASFEPSPNFACMDCKRSIALNAFQQFEEPDQ